MNDEKCTSCGQGLPDYYDLSQTALVAKVLSAWENDDRYSRYPRDRWTPLGSLEVGAVHDIPRLGQLEVIHKIGPDYDDSAGYRLQPLELVMKITPLSESPRFFKLVGEYSSFDGTSWGIDFKEVAEKPKMIMVWE